MTVHVRRRGAYDAACSAAIDGDTERTAAEGVTTSTVITCDECLARVRSASRSTVAYEWEGGLDRTHDTSWMIQQVVADRSFFDRSTSEFALVDHDGWHLPTAKGDRDGTSVKLCGVAVVDALAGRRVRVTVEIVD